MVQASGDQELQAIQQIISSLEALDPEARRRVIEYVFRRLGLAAPQVAQTGAGVSSVSPAHIAPVGRTDIRTLAEQKVPKSATEMAAVAAYYLSELAPTDERKSEITASDVTKLFKQANFPLPGSPKMTLVHAKNAGYLDPGTARGAYKLNPVGYNLVAHKLPSSDAPSPTPMRRKRARRKPGTRKK